MIIAILWFALSSFASPSMNLGFYPLSSGEIPSAVKEQQHNLFRFEIPYFAEVRAKFYLELMNNPKISAAGKADLQNCLEKKAPTCWIHFAQERGTAFLIDEGDSLWTNCHLVSTWIQYRKQQLLLDGVEEKNLWAQLKESSIPFVLRNAQGEIQKQAFERAVFRAGVFRGMDQPRELYCSPQDDAVKIQIFKKAGPGTKKSSRSPLEGEQLYLGGFPRPTNTRAEGKNSDGENFFWSYGEYLSRSSLGSHLGRDLEKDFSFSNPYSEGFLGDSSQGMSGGAVFNDQGEVLGIYKGFLPQDREKQDLPLASQFITNAGLRYIEIYSESLFR